MPIKAHMLPAFVAIMAVTTAGILHLNWWALLAGACVLILISLTSSSGSFARYGHDGSSISLPTILLSTTLNAVVTATASFGLGRLIAWCWGI